MLEWITAGMVLVVGGFGIHQFVRHQLEEHRMWVQHEIGRRIIEDLEEEGVDIQDWLEEKNRKEDTQEDTEDFSIPS